MCKFSPLVVLIILGIYSQSQIVLVVAKDKESSAIDCKVEWGYTYPYEATDAAR